MSQVTSPTSIFINPAGNFYGSEQLLIDYIKNTPLHFHLFSAQISLFKSKLIKIKHKNFRKKSIAKVKPLYFDIFL
jgi:hypothetical protein